MESKVQVIRKAIQETRQRRKNQKVVVYQLKLQNLSKRKQELLARVFAEAKWLYNYLVSDISRLNVPANKISTVQVKVSEAFEQRQLLVLGSQVKQEIADRLRDNLRALDKLKKKGYNVGTLKPKKFVNSIPLKQYGVTYKLNFAYNRVRIQKLGDFRVLGLHQIPKGAEIANAVLVRKPSGYYLHVTCYLLKEHFKKEHIAEAVGIDFGVSNKIILSNGLAIDFELHETRRLKKLHRKLSRAKKGSKNRKKLQLLLRREYEKIANKRRDAQNKIMAFLKLYNVVIFQDDFIKGWTKNFGKQVHSSAIGGLKSRLKNSLETPIAIDRFEPTSQECYVCGKVHKLSLSDRTMRCDCGWVCDRDLNAALVILKKGLELSEQNFVGLDRPEVKPLEKGAAARILGSNPHIRVSLLQ